MIAEDLNLDPLEIRIKNGLKRGDVAPNKFRIKSSGHVESIEKASRAVGWRDNWKKLPKGTGIGIGANFFASGAGWHFHYDTEIPHSTVKIEVSESGSVTLLSGASDIGQGIETVLTQIAAEELGVNVEDIRIIAADTGVTPVDLGSYSSRVTLMAGNAAKMAAKDAKEKLLKIAADMLEANVEDLEASNRRIYVKGSPEKGKSFVEVVRACLNKTNAPVIGNGYYYPPVEEFMLNFETGEVNLSPTYSFGAHSALVKVDMETGEVRVETLAAAHDCGVAINPMSVEGQIEGSVSMAFGQALLENFWFDGGQMLNPSLLNYKLATSLDMPETKPIIVESDDPEGPFGAKEASEGVLIPTMPAIANAVYNAIGVRIKELPITPEKVLRGLEKKKGGGI
jgi:4-hydroxybenzoyl-CoA reductase subunit alpha